MFRAAEESFNIVLCFKGVFQNTPNFRHVYDIIFTLEGVYDIMMYLEILKFTLETKVRVS